MAAQITPMRQMTLDLPDFESHIGARLREARETLSLDMDTVAGALKINSGYIDAIENLNKAALPSIGYVLGYVRAYAQFVGLDGQAAVEDFKTDSEVPENLGLRDRPHFVPKRQIRLPKGFFAASTVLSAMAVLAFWYSSKTDAHSAALTAQTDFNGAEVQTMQSETIDPNRILIKATSPSWIEIKDEDQKVIISRILVTGESWEGHQDDNVTVSARDSGALEIYLGKDLIGQLGTKGVPVADVSVIAIQPTADTKSAKNTPN